MCVQSSLQAKGVPPGGFAEMEEWALNGGAVTLVWRYRQVPVDLLCYGQPRLPGRMKMLANGEVAVPIFPAGRADRMLFMGVWGESWGHRWLT